MKVIIIGGVAGGMSAATRLRRLNEEAEIIIFEKGPFVSFANCGLPYYVSGEISNEERDTAISLIEKRLGQTKQGLTHTVHTFLEEKGYLTNVSKLSSEGFVFVRRQLQAYRHRWLDALIKEFS